MSVAKESAAFVKEAIGGKYHIYTVEAVIFAFCATVVGMYTLGDKSDFTVMEQGLWAANIGLCLIVCVLLYTRWIRDYRRNL